MSFDTVILDQAIADKQARDEEERLATLAQLLSILESVAGEYGIQRAYIFGSLVHPGRFRPDSDVDIAVEQELAANYFAVLARLVAALGREVDLIELSRCHFADKIRQEGLRWTSSD